MHVYIMERTKFTTTIQTELLKEAKKKAIDEDKNLNEVIENLLKKWLI